MKQKICSYIHLGKSKGFTLIELIFALGIASLLLLSLSSILHSSLDYSQQFNRQVRSQADINFHLDSLARELLSCDLILKQERGRLDFLTYEGDRKATYHYVSYRIRSRKLYRLAFTSEKKEGMSTGSPSR